MNHSTREGCCADRRKPCSYHEGWEDALDTVPDGWARIDGEWVQVAQADRYDVEGPSGVIDGANVLITLPKRQD